LFSVRYQIHALLTSGIPEDNMSVDLTPLSRTSLPGLQNGLQSRMRTNVHGLLPDAFVAKGGFRIRCWIPVIGQERSVMNSLQTSR